MDLEKKFWDSRYETAQTGWDVGYPTPPITEYAAQLTNKDLSILIPGCGRAYEAQFLHEHGFTQVSVLDISEYPLKAFSERVPSFPKGHLLNQDFYSLKGQFDLILEQTFFCAQDPRLRPAYVEQVHQLLKPGGKLVGVLFGQHFPGEAHPPFGGSAEEYRGLFEPYFEIEVMAPAYNSIKPRAGKELFIKMRKKS